MNTLNTTATLIEVTSETNVCECCGKSDLKRVAVLRLESGSIVRYGRDCAARKLGKSTGKSIDLYVETVANIQKSIELIDNNINKYAPEVISNKINLSVNCTYNNGTFSIGYAKTLIVNYTPEVYRTSVNWWAE